MKHISPCLLFLYFLVLSTALHAQSAMELYAGPVLQEELRMKAFPADTNASALVLAEVGSADIDLDQSERKVELHYRYSVRIKILKTAGIDAADVRVLLLRSLKGDKEEITDVKGTSYNLQADGSVATAELDRKKVFTVDQHELYGYASFAVPDVRAGTVIEYSYVVNTPFYDNFHSWRFQSHTPKLRSIFTAHIPANYEYRISLKGFQKLSNQEATLEKECLNLGQNGKADCSRLMFEMKDIPAFHPEKYMLSEENYLSSIDFELAAYKSFFGGTQFYSQTWKDADRYLRQDKAFGGQIRRGVDFYKTVLDSVVKSGNSDSLKARQVFRFIRDHFNWNKYYGYYSSTSIKKLYDARTGSSADINLMLVSALQAVGIQAEPVLISARTQAKPRKIFPVLGDFDYVIASVTIGKDSWFLDATNKHLAFGMISVQCLSNEGRLFPSKDSSRWVAVQVPFKRKTISSFDLTVEPTGVMKGTGIFYFAGYKGLEQRELREKYNSEDEYLEEQSRSWRGCRIQSFSESGLVDPEIPYSNTYQLLFNDRENTLRVAGSRIQISPFISSEFSVNPFSLPERAYPVDFGYCMEQMVVVKLHLPKGYKVSSQPKNTSFKLPGDGGYFIMEQESEPGLYILSYHYQLSKPVYSSQEYDALKEFLSQMIAIEKSPLVLAQN